MKILLAIVVLLAPSLPISEAFAQEISRPWSEVDFARTPLTEVDGSEFFQLTPGGATQATLMPYYSSAQRGEARVNTRAIGLGVEHGFDDQWALKLESTFGDAVARPSDSVAERSYKGFSDLSLVVKYRRYILSASRLNLQLRGSTSVGSADTAGEGDVGNRMSGRMAIGPTLAVETDFRGGLIGGAYARYEWRSAGAEALIAGGIYGEIARYSWRAGLNAALIANENASAIDSAIGTQDRSAHARLSTYGLLETGWGLEVRPELAYTTRVDRASLSPEDAAYDALDISITARWEL